jgi:hypothetical protein
MINTSVSLEALFHPVDVLLDVDVIDTQHKLMKEGIYIRSHIPGIESGRTLLNHFLLLLVW